jgi:hypothetical protein
MLVSILVKRIYGLQCCKFVFTFNIKSLNVNLIKDGLDR